MGTSRYLGLNEYKPHILSSLAKHLLTTCSALMIDNQCFHYKPLDTETFPIRVLQLLPGNFSDSIECTLKNYADTSEAGWTCLSYAWDTEPATKEITINGDSFLVRPNVYDFLLEARRRGLTNLWIDSICINQSDIDERNAQVDFMSAIFGEAKQVVVWLGHTSPALERAVNVLSSGFDPETKRVSVAAGKAVFGQMSPAECTSLFEACSAAVWTRRWVKQEILIPRTVMMFCGQAFVSINVFLAVMEALSDYDGLHTHSVTVAEHSYAIQSGIEIGPCFGETKHLDQRERQCANVLALNLASRTKTTGDEELPQLLEQFKGSLCTDFHDYVYAFRGLASQGIDLRVDYSLSTTQMFLQTLDFIAKTTHGSLPGNSDAERNLLANIYKGFNMTPPDLETILEDQHTVYLVQIGYSFEMLRKDVSVWVFVDSLTDLNDFVSSAWRERSLQSSCLQDCSKVLIQQQKYYYEYHIVLNQLLVPDVTEEGRRLWLYGLRKNTAPNLMCLRAVYEPSWFYGCTQEKAETLNGLIRENRSILAMAFDPCGEKDKLLEWLDEVKDHMIVTVTDRDDAGRQIQISLVPGCEDEECLLQRCFEEPVKVRRQYNLTGPTITHTHGHQYSKDEEAIEEVVDEDDQNNSLAPGLPFYSHEDGDLG